MHLIYVFVFPIETTVLIWKPCISGQYVWIIDSDLLKLVEYKVVTGIKVYTTDSLIMKWEIQRS